MRSHLYRTNAFSQISTRILNYIPGILFALLIFVATAMKSQVNINSTGGQSSTTTYSTLKLAFDSINIGKHTGTIVITITANTTETATAALNASGSGGASYSSILIKPTGGGLKTISASLAAPLVDLNGADNVTIDGLYPGNDSLLIVNASTSTTAGTCTIRFINGACNNAIQNCGVFGGSASTTSGTIFFSTDGITGNGNDNNVISSVLLGDAASAATPRYGVYAAGTTGAENNNNTIKGCWIYNFFASTTGDRAGIFIGSACTDFTIYNNSFYQDVTRSVSSATYSGIYINNTSGKFLIRKNKIGGSAPDCGGSQFALTSAPLLQAIYLNVATSAKTIVDSNQISNISMSTTNTSIIQSLIHINNGKVDIKYNTLGSQTTGTSISIPSVPSSTTFSAIGMGSGSFDTINISYNTIGGISITGSGMSLRGIDITGSTATMLINNNIFGSPGVANSLYQAGNNSILAIIMRANYAGVTHQINNNVFANLTAAIGTIRCIYTGGATSTFDVTGNLIYNITSSRNTAGVGVNAAVVAIISSAAGPNQNISKNTIYAMKVTGSGAGAMTVSGINVVNSPTGNNIISGNLIHSLNVDVAGGTLNGIDLSSGDFSCFNNMIRLGVDETGAAITTPLYMNGINETAGVNSFYFNSIYIGGSGVTTGSANTAAVNSTLTSVARNIKNNIFCNLRTNATSTGKHYSVIYTGVSSQVINNNDYWTGTSFLSQNNATDYASLLSWQTATSQDSLSVSSNPVFKNPGGTTSTLNLHIDTAGTSINSLESSGVAISGISIDYDNDSRPGPSGSVKGGGTKPDIGADEFDGVPRPPCSNTVAGTTTAPLDTICISGSTTLGLTGSSGLGVGNSYQWQSSSNGSSFTDITNANLNVYSTPTLTSTTWFRCVVKCANGSTTSNSTAKKITILNPQVGSVTPNQRCGNGTLVLNATSIAGTLRWFAAATGGTVLDTGVTFTTPTLSATTTYYVEAAIANCVTATRTPVVATILVIPTISAIANGSNCGAGTVTLNATPSAGIVNWYAAATGGTSLATGSSFTTPSITVTTTYYVDATNAGCTTSSRTAVTATIIPLPTITSTTPATACGSGSVVLKATASAGFIRWYSTATGGTPLDTGTTFTTPVIFAPTTYYIEAKDGNCLSSPRTIVIAGVVSVPTINGVTGGNGCSGDKITLSATPSAGAVNWYTASTGGTAIATGNSFTTPSLTNTTTYYVDASNAGCTTSFRTPVNATINATPTITNITNASVCGSGSLTLGATSNIGLIDWYSDSTGTNLLFTGNSFTTPVLTTTTLYFIEAKSNGCKSARTRVTATIKKIPTITGVTPAYVCKSGTVTLGAAASSGTVRWYSVSFGGGVIGTGTSFTPSVINSTTTYYVDAIDSGCVSASRTAVDATVYPALDKTTTTSGNTITATATGVTYVWVDCNNGYQAIAGETNKTFTATKNGSYAVVVKSAFCSDTSACTVFNKIGISNNYSNNEITILPNPANDYLVLKTTDIYFGSSFTITDLSGRIVMEGNISNSNQRIDIHELASGSYILSVDNEHKKSFRIIKN